MARALKQCIEMMMSTLFVECDSVLRADSQLKSARMEEGKTGEMMRVGNCQMTVSACAYGQTRTQRGNVKQR